MKLGPVVERLTEPLSNASDVSAVDAATLGQLPPIGDPEVYFASLANGNAGLAWACGFLDKAYPDLGWDRIAHTYLLRAAQALGEGMPGLFDGLAGVGLAAEYLSRDQSRYQRLLASIEASLGPGVDRLCRAIEANGAGCHCPIFDLISGLSGIVIFLSRRAQSGPAVAMMEKSCAALCRLILASSDKPAWRQPRHLLRETREAFDLNIGLAHGLPGMVVALGRAKATEAIEHRLDEALVTAVDHLVNLSSSDAFGRNWASWQGGGGGAPLAALESRTAWCYGAPGVCSALWLAGEYASKPEWRELAYQGMVAVQDRTLGQGWSEGPTFCHGTAGVLHIAQRFEQRCGGLAPLRDLLLERLIEQYDADSALGYQDQGANQTKLDRLGLLQGTTGILLVLLQFERPDLEPDWDEAFALR